MNLFYQSEISEGILNLDAEESRHAVRVLRLRENDLLDLTDGKGSFYSARIAKSDPNKCEFQILDRKIVPTRNYRIHIAIAPTKNIDRTEWFVEKATEIGIDEITFFLSENSERNIIKLDRIEKIAISAIKQSLQAWLPKINELVSFHKMVTSPADQKFIAYMDASNPILFQTRIKKSRSYLVVIGPEGDFSNEELSLAMEHQFEKVSLGTNRLRTETAGLTACQTVHFINS